MAKSRESKEQQYPDILDVASESTVTGPYTCYYRASFRASLNRTTQTYHTEKDQFISMDPDTDKNGRFKVCPRSWISNVSVPAKNVHSDETNHVVQADLWTPFGNFSGGISLFTKKGPRIGEVVESETSVFKLSVQSRTVAKPGKA